MATARLTSITLSFRPKEKKESVLNKAQTAPHLSLHVLSQSKRPSCCVMADHILFDVASLHLAICKVLRVALHPKRSAETSAFGNRKDRFV